MMQNIQKNYVYVLLYVPVEKCTKIKRILLEKATHQAKEKKKGFFKKIYVNIW